MKLVKLICPVCGAKLDIDTEDTICRCPYCGGQVYVDDKVHHHKMDNDFEYGYESEKDKQKTIEEIEAEKAAKEYEALQQQEELFKKSQTTVFLQALYGGWFGLHKFTTGFKSSGFLYMFTGGLWGIGTIIDLINIARGTYTDCFGRTLNYDLSPEKLKFHLIIYGIFCVILLLIGSYGAS